MSATSPLYIGGLLRCCVETLRTTETRDEDGETLTCRHCKKETMRFDGRAAHPGWRWVGAEFTASTEDET